MKTLTLGLILLSLTIVAVADDYTYTISMYEPVPDLHGTESLLMIVEGGDHDIALWDSSSARIESTSILKEGSGGIWYLSLSGSSYLDMSGGQVNQLTMNNNATARLTGGLIQQIWSYQYTDTFGPHITIVYSGDLPTVQMIHDLPHLVGNWGNGDPFSIYLSEVPANDYGYDPAIEDIQFELVPEPITLALLAFGGLMLRSKKR